MSTDGSRDPLGGRRWLAFATAAFLLGSGLLAGCGGEPGDPAEGAGSDADPIEDGGSGAVRPPTVPGDFVTTPHGYFHPSCVVEVAEGETLRDDGVLLRADGEAREVAGCRHARYDREGRQITRRSAVAGTLPAVVNGWVAATSSTSAGPVQEISATWRVPAAPTRARGQTLYFFVALEPAATGAFILQPVLAWNGFDDQRWTIASWNCCKDGAVLHSPPRPVSPGDRISGSVIGESCDAEGVCASWTVRAVSSRGTSTTLATGSYGAALDWEFGGAFEAFGVDACDQYPRDGRITFSSIVVRRIGGAAVTPAWVTWMYVWPSCLTRFGPAIDGTSVTMTWTAR
jgi:hypothetical protein